MQGQFIYMGYIAFYCRQLWKMFKHDNMGYCMQGQFIYMGYIVFYCRQLWKMFKHDNTGKHNAQCVYICNYVAKAINYIAWFKYTLWWEIMLSI